MVVTMKRGMSASVLVLASLGTAAAQPATEPRDSPPSTMAPQPGSCEAATAPRSSLFGLSQDALTGTDDSGALAIDESVASPLSVTLSYWLVSDYIFRGINYSEYAGEGREKPNHQLEVKLDVDVARLFLLLSSSKRPHQQSPNRY